jgi:signal transduction histidine kinase
MQMKLSKKARHAFSDKYAQQTVTLRIKYLLFAVFFSILLFVLFDLQLPVSHYERDRITALRFLSIIVYLFVCGTLQIKRFRPYAQIFFFIANLSLTLCIMNMMTCKNSLLLHDKYLSQLLVALCLGPLLIELNLFLVILLPAICAVVYYILFAPPFHSATDPFFVYNIFNFFLIGFFTFMVRLYLQRLTIANRKRKRQIERETIKLQSAYVKLLHLDSFKNKMLSVLSHDLRGPLNNILALHELNTAGVLSEKERTDADEMIKTSTIAAIQLLNNLLEWAGGQTEGAAIRITKVRLNKAVDEVILLFKYAAQIKGLRLINEVTEHTLLETDPAVVQLLLRNFISNAIKFTAKGTVKVGCKETANGHELYVRDTGVGITKETMESLILKERVKSSTGTNKEKGAGFGLLLCQDYLEKINGKLKVEPEIKGGTTFSVFIPK